MVRCFNSVFGNNITGTKEAYVEKIPGWASNATPASGNNGTAITYFPYNGGFLIGAFGSTSTIYRGTTALGTLTTDEVATRFTIGFIGDATSASDLLPTLFFTDNAGQGWFTSKIAGSRGFTGDTHSNTTIDNLSENTGVQPGQLITGTGIPANTRITAVNIAGNSITISNAATSTAAGVDLTEERISLIPGLTNYELRGNIIEQNGYVFCAAVSGASGFVNQSLILQSSLNDPYTWLPTTQFIVPHASFDSPVTIAKYKDYIVYWGDNTVQFFRYAGNPSGSVLDQVDQLSSVGVGAVGGGNFIGTNGMACVTDIGGTIYWLGVSNGVIRGIYRLNGFAPELISPAATSRQLSAVIASMNSGTSIAFDGFSAFGDDFIYVGTGDIGYVYSVNTESWVEAGFFSGGMRIAGGLSTTANPTIYGLRMTGTTGKTYVMDKTNLTYQDDSSAYTMTIQTPAVSLNKGRPFVVTNVRLLADKQASGTTTFEVSDDDFANFTTCEAFDMTLDQMMSGPCGYFRSHAIFRLTHSANTAWRGQALQVEWEPA